MRPGYLDDVELDATLRRAAALAFPSVYEGFGFPPLQAMAAGVPVVATAAGAVPEVVGDGALLVQPGDGDAMAGRPGRVLEGGDEIDALVSRGTARADLFTWADCAAGLAALYHDAADASHRRRRVSGAAGSSCSREQLRRRAPGGIGTYVRGLLQGLDVPFPKPSGPRPSSPPAARPALPGHPSPCPISGRRCGGRACPGVS